MTEFSFRTRAANLRKMEREMWDLLVIGGGITGASVARDAARRGLRVAVVEQGDFASGTSSRSSKLIHGGLRYLENLEIHLVFEALSERTLLMKTMPHMVRPLPFYLPVYRGDQHPAWQLSLGLWAYDLLALMHTPKIHQRFNSKKFLQEIPILKSEGLLGGFCYFDATMLDDVMTIEVARSAGREGAVLANYVSALRALWYEGQVQGFEVKDNESGRTFSLASKRVIVCAGPWADSVGALIDRDWKDWLAPSKGVHLVFDLKRIPIPGALVMSHPTDGRISFVIPRGDLGAGCVIVGTTDGPTDTDPSKALVAPEDIQYLMDLLRSYFPNLNLTTADIVSTYVGVRPLMKPNPKQGEKLQKVSREHHIGRGPGGTVFVVGGKYTTHRRMAKEIMDFTMKAWNEDAKEGRCTAPPGNLRPAHTEEPINPEALGKCDTSTAELLKLYDRYGAEAQIVAQSGLNLEDPEGFPYFDGQIEFALKNQMALHLDDLFMRRLPIAMTRKDRGMPWALRALELLARERGLETTQRTEEMRRLERALG